MKCTLSKDSLPYATIVFDIIRVFLPHLSWQELLDDTTEDQQILEIKVCGTNIVVGFLVGKKIYEINSAGDNNELRRLIKLAVYRFFTEILRFDSSPWGILTGIRPTKIVHRYLDQGIEETKVKEIMTKSFLLNEDKSQKLVETAGVQRKYLLGSLDALKKVSIYISIPFCPTRCSYCSFPSFPIGQNTILINDFLHSLVKEIIEIGCSLKTVGKEIQTIYIGGGTPTTLNPTQLETLLEAVRTSLHSAKTLEYTIEAGRPDTISQEKLLLLKKYQVDRISINPQTMCDETLLKVGRNHSAQDIIEKFALAREIGFNNINMDLIIGLPDEGLTNIKHTLKEIKKLKPDNLTLHALAIKRTAQLQEESIGKTLINEIHEMFLYAEEWALENGYSPYYLYRQKQILGNQENVGYSLEDKPCIYNIQMIEERQTIWGLGVGASSKIVNPLDWTLTNWHNPKDIIIYNQRINEIIKTKVDKIIDLS